MVVVGLTTHPTFLHWLPDGAALWLPLPINMVLIEFLMDTNAYKEFKR